MRAALNLLVEKLTPVMRQALEQSAWQCRSMTHFDVEIEHLLFQMTADENGDCPRILTHFQIDRTRLATDLAAALERLRRGNSRDTPGISPRIAELLSEAWMHSSLELGGDRLRSGSVLFALLAGAEMSRLAAQISRELRRIDTDALAEDFGGIVEGSSEGLLATPASRSDAGSTAGINAASKALQRFTVDLTERARNGRIDPVLGRDREVRQMIDVLLRRRQNNPILTGEPGVGKTAVVEGFALKIASGDIPEALRNVAVRALDLGLLQAGAGVRGEFEERLKSVIQEVLESPTPIILFIDEAHTLIGAGGAEGQNDAANLLKPPLARGELRTIAATTWAEYKKYFEKDAALARRFQVVKIDEPDERTAIAMLRGVAPVLERHHEVRILPEALEAAVRWSSRYLSDRQLPDKAISVLDTACARVAVAQASTPGSVEDLKSSIETLESEQVLLVRESATGADHGARLREIAAALGSAREELQTLENRWTKERNLVSEILGTRARIGSDPSTQGGQRTELVTMLRKAEGDLRSLQGGDPLVHPCVDEQGVAAVLSAWTGIPVGRMLADEIQTVLELEAHLAKRVIGQDAALRTIAHSIRTARAGLGDPGRPIGVFLLLGPSGVGKTESALSLAELLYGGERNVITINMSEYQEAHTVSGLKGSPPGYVGYGQGGVLTEAVRRRPFSVVLLDEVEKAHPDVLELFYQVFDKGTLEDGEGRRIDFRNTVILLTSNVASNTIHRLCDQAERPPSLEKLRAAVQSELVAQFKPALVGRMTIVPYLPLSDEVMRRIVELKISRIVTRLREQHGTELEVESAVIENVLERCSQAETGARNIDHLLNGSLLPELANRILVGLAGSGIPDRISVRLGDDGEYEYQES